MRYKYLKVDHVAALERKRNLQRFRLHVMCFFKKQRKKYHLDNETSSLFKSKSMCEVVNSKFPSFQRLVFLIILLP